MFLIQEDHLKCIPWHFHTHLSQSSPTSWMNYYCCCCCCCCCSKEQPVVPVTADVPLLCLCLAVHLLYLRELALPQDQNWHLLCPLCLLLCCLYQLPGSRFSFAAPSRHPSFRLCLLVVLVLCRGLCPEWNGRCSFVIARVPSRGTRRFGTPHYEVFFVQKQLRFVVRRQTLT